MPNWVNFASGQEWGSLVAVKQNAGAILVETLQSMKVTDRAKLRIFMASTTDPYQPLEEKNRITRQCLTAFTNFNNLDPVDRNG